MTIKTCKCGFVGDESLFRKDRSQCKKCRRESLKRYYEENKEYHAAKNKAWSNANPESVKAIQKKYCDANKEIRAAKNKVWRSANKEYYSDLYKANKEAINASHKEYRVNNPIKIREKGLRWSTLKGRPEELIKTQAVVNYIKHELKKEG